jgi:hypothetical protein
MKKYGIEVKTAKITDVQLPQALMARLENTTSFKTKIQEQRKRHENTIRYLPPYSTSPPPHFFALVGAVTFTKQAKACMLTLSYFRIPPSRRWYDSSVIKDGAQQEIEQLVKNNARLKQDITAQIQVPPISALSLHFHPLAPFGCVCFKRVPLAPCTTTPPSLSVLPLSLFVYVQELLMLSQPA